MGFLSTFVQGLEAILTTKGDILSFSSVRARLGVGSNDQVLTADSGEATGLKWASAGGGGVSESILGGFYAHNGATAEIFKSLGFPPDGQTLSESGAQLAYPYAVTVIRGLALVSVATTGADSTSALRDDASDVALITISAGVSGDYDTGAISVSISIHSQLCFEADINGSGTLTINYWSMQS